MSNIIQIKRGNGTPSGLAEGELGYSKDSGILYIGKFDSNSEQVISEPILKNKVTPISDFLYQENIAASSGNTDICANPWFLLPKQANLLFLNLGIQRRNQTGWAGQIFYTNLTIPIIDTGRNYSYPFSIIDDIQSKEVSGIITIRVYNESKGKYFGCFNFDIKTGQTLSNNVDDATTGRYRLVLSGYII